MPDGDEISDLSPELRMEIASVIGEVVSGVFQAMFHKTILMGHGGVGVTIQQDKTEKAVNDEHIVTMVNLAQGTLKAQMRAMFDYDLLYALISDIYSDDLLKERTTLEDSACEITNIVGSRIKALMNSHGFRLHMDFPCVEREGEGRVDDKVINLHFSLDDDNLHVGFGTENNLETA
jgi:CheY-specific phosphatase CheX